MKPLSEIFRSYCVFDANGKHANGTDKQSNHNYGDAYDSILNREAIQLMLEIGVADGSSLRAWQEGLPNATVVGMDIHPAATWNGEFHLGDQRNLDDCLRVAHGRQFDLIVEDATHELPDTLATLLYFWPFVKPGGLYIVEEFRDIAGLFWNVKALWPFVDIVDTTGPFGGNEPLVVFRRPS